MATISLNKIRTEDEIDLIVSRVPGTWVKHRNVRAKLVQASNDLVETEIANIKKVIRGMISEKACKKRPLYAQVTHWELQLIA